MVISFTKLRFNSAETSFSYWVKIVCYLAAMLFVNYFSKHCLSLRELKMSKGIDQLDMTCYTDPAWLSLTNERKFVD